MATHIIEIPSTLPIHLVGGKIPETIGGKTDSNGRIQSDGAPAALRAKIRATPGVKTLAAPRVTTRSGTRAIIQVGHDWQPDSQAKPIFIGQTLDLNPTVAARTITLAATYTDTVLLLPSVTPAPADNLPPSSQRVPTSTVSSTVTLDDGQTLILTEPEPATADRRLLIFITARLINPKGLAPLH